MASDGVKEGLRRLAKAIEMLAWLWLALCLSLGALSAWGQQAPPTYDANFQQAPNTIPPINSPKIASAPPERAAPAPVKPSIDPQIDPSKVQWDAEPKGDKLPGLPPAAITEAAGNDPFSRFMAHVPGQEVKERQPLPKSYGTAFFLAFVGLVGFAILRTLAWILAGFAK